MLKPTIIISSIILMLATYIHGNPRNLPENSLSSMVTFIKPAASAMRRLNPLKLFFTVAHTPTQSPHYSVEWNFPLLKTMFLESKHVSNDDKELFRMKFGNADSDYVNWSPEKHDELERFTEKYLNVYKSPDSFLPFLDCQALTYAMTDEMLHDLQPIMSDEKRSKVRAKAVERLCDSE
ncbi:unnamed protein product [Rotaria socialis]|uniref:Uncharacterized protein n=1 Tax=Rotaria socialis TaxID=392032 RepID=A0A821BUV8_9BILA|nr:unnamed protein product [Rotaria socialis]CAF3304723.1 unnamed protein product [Rotaria socialis]CAF3427848.1 unnamed protein product [Rotaria socialis]CAF3593931.1 unnamed protein product [Rotaria socialis]CAF3770009.1 unnamed protein product [Rotaria socialis]